MGDAKLKIVIDALNNASKELQALKKDLVGVDEQGKTTNRGVGDLKSGFDRFKDTILPIGAALVGVGVAIKKTFVFAYEGANIQRLETAGRSLASSMGMSMDEIVAKVREASLGTVSDYDIMQSATRAMMLGIGTSAEQMAKLMEIAAIRGRALGQSATTAFNDIVSGIGRMSPEILDNLGIVIDANTTFRKYAESVGKSADQLTSMEKRQALLNAVMKDGDKLLRSSGGLTNDNASKMERFDAAAKNFGDNLKEMLAGPGADFLEWLNNQKSPADKAREALEGINKKYKEQHEVLMKTTTTYRGYTEGMVKLADSITPFNSMTKEMVKNGLDLVDQYGELTAEQAEVMVSNGQMTRSQGETYIAFLRFREELQKWIKAGGGYTEEMYRWVRANEVNAKSMEAMKESGQWLNDYSLQMETAGKATTTLKDEQSLLRDEMSGLKELMSGQFGPAVEEFRDKQKALKDEAKLLTEQVKKLEGVKYKTPAQEAELNDLKGKLEANRLKMEELGRQFELESKRMIFNMILQKAASDGLTSKEIQNLTALAKQWGLLDSKTAEVAQAISGLDFENMSLEDLEKTLQRMYALPDIKKYDIEVAVNVTGNGVGVTVDGITFTLKRGEWIASAAGNDFIVPPGYEHDRFPILAQSGEHVRIERPGTFTRAAAGVDMIVPAGYGGGRPVVSQETRTIIREASRPVREDGGGMVVNFYHYGNISSQLDLQAEFSRLLMQIQNRR